MLFLLTVVLFFLANRAAYKGYFRDDELDNIGWTTQLPKSDFARALVTPRFLSHNYRPTGHFFFHAMGRRFGLSFTPYVAAIQLLHLLNVVLLWLIARRLGTGALAAAAGVLLFAFHMSALDIWWKPMYVFDLLCGSFFLLSFLFWLRKQWLLSFLAFVLAYKSKELAVMFPAVLLCYEFLLGERRWRRILPFAAVSLCFGIQALLQNSTHDDSYTLRFTPSAIWRCAVFYASAIVPVAYGGFVLPLAGLISRDRRVWFGIAAAFLMLSPLLFLPGRLHAAYVYVSLIGLALALSSLLAPHPKPAAIVFFAVWIAANYAGLRIYRRQTLATAENNRRYVEELQSLSRRAPDLRTFVTDGLPDRFNVWGVHGAIQYLFHLTEFPLADSSSPQTRELWKRDPVALLTWDSTQARLLTLVRRSSVPDASYISMERETPLWQLTEGWHGREPGFRWAAPRATARVMRPTGARAFELVLNISPGQLRDAGPVRARVLIDGEIAGERVFELNGWQKLEIPLAGGQPGLTTVEIDSQRYKPSNGDPRNLGVAVVALGFVS